MAFGQPHVQLILSDQLRSYLSILQQLVIHRRLVVRLKIDTLLRSNLQATYRLASEYPAVIRFQNPRYPNK